MFLNSSINKFQSKNSENKKESSDKNNEDQNINNNKKDEIKSAVPKSNSSQNKDRKKVSNTKPLLVIFSLAVIFIGILSYHYGSYFVLSSLDSSYLISAYLIISDPI